MKKIGIIGTGQIAQSHLRQWAQIDEIQGEALCDLDEKALDLTAKEFGVPGKFTDFRELLKREDLDGVDVCLHNNLHAPVTIEALEAGKMLHIQLARIYEECTQAARMLIEAGELGHIYHARATEYRRRGVRRGGIRHGHGLFRRRAHSGHTCVLGH